MHQLPVPLPREQNVRFPWREKGALLSRSTVSHAPHIVIHAIKVRVLQGPLLCWSPGGQRHWTPILDGHIHDCSGKSESRQRDGSRGSVNQGRPGPHRPPEGATGLSYRHIGTVSVHSYSCVGLSSRCRLCLTRVGFFVLSSCLAWLVHWMIFKHTHPPQGPVKYENV